MNKAVFISFLLFPGALSADVPVKQVKEVTYLLNYVRNSDCLINRNGTDYIGGEAVKHIEKKYAYFRNDIKSTEDFIGFSATKSTMSGKNYMVTCPENKEEKKVVNTQAWLLEELRRYRLIFKKSRHGSNENKYTVCKKLRPKACTREYKPVCAKRKDNSFDTYATGCSACSDLSVVKYKAGQC